MYHQCDSEPYDWETEGDFPIDGDALRGIAAGLLVFLLMVGAPLAFFMDAMPLGFVILAVGVAGLTLVWITSDRR